MSDKGFISGPTPEQLKLTPAEQAHMRALLDWQERSARCKIVFGPSVSCPKCFAQNNPNNVACHQCGERL